MFPEKNVLRLAPLAEEYQVTAIITKCKTVMESIVSKAQAKIKSATFTTDHLEPLRECLNVLKSAVSLNYTNVFNLSIDAVARFGYGLYTKVEIPVSPYFNKYSLDRKTSYKSNETYADVRNECITLYRSLSLRCRNIILLCRLGKVDKNLEFI